MEEERAIWSAKEKASIEAIGEKAKSYNVEIMMLSKEMAQVRFIFHLLTACLHVFVRLCFFLLLFVGIIVVHEFMEHYKDLKFFLCALSMLQIILANFQLCMHNLLETMILAKKVLYP